MINAINSNLISLLWAQAQNIVPALWLCTWLCWFFYITSFHLPLSRTRGFSVLVTRCGSADEAWWKRWNCQFRDEFSVQSHPNSTRLLFSIISAQTWKMQNSLMKLLHFCFLKCPQISNISHLCASVRLRETEQRESNAKATKSDGISSEEFGNCWTEVVMEVSGAMLKCKYKKERK